MGRFVNPFTDIGFKVIVGSELSKDVLIQLLNALLEGEHHIEDLAFLDKEDHSDNVHDRGIVYDWRKWTEWSLLRGIASKFGMKWPGTPTESVIGCLQCMGFS